MRGGGLRKITTTERYRRPFQPRGGVYCTEMYMGRRRMITAIHGAFRASTCSTCSLVLSSSLCSEAITHHAGGKSGERRRMRRPARHTMTRRPSEHLRPFTPVHARRCFPSHRAF